MFDSELVKLACRARLLTATGLPAVEHRVWANAKYTPTTGTQYIDETLSVNEGSVKTLPASTGQIEVTGRYIVTWFGIAGTGESAIRAGVAAILAVFPPAWSATLSNGDVLRIRTDTIPLPQDLTPLDDGFAYMKASIPWRCTSTNAVT